MKFSILLPTRNRLEYLRLAVTSVLRQDFEDWEIVISDNCSEDDIAGYVAELADPRIVYTRTERSVPVTENWNRALAHSSGDYVVMLGDDDALLGSYLREMGALIERFARPELIYTKSLLFTYPSVDPLHPGGFLMENGCAEFFDDATDPFLLAPHVAQRLVRAAMSFRLRYDFNAQFVLISRGLIESLREFGDFYQSAFPDYYSTNACFLRARSIVVDPDPKVVIGVTPKSYGYFHVNDREAEGRGFLDAAAASQASGTNINVGWLSAATALEQGIGRQLGLGVDHRRYRLVQAAHVYLRYRSGAGTRAEVRSFERELPPLERSLFRLADRSIALVHRLLPTRLKAVWASLAARRVGQLATISPTIVDCHYGDILDVCEARSPTTPAAQSRSAAGDR